MKDVRSPLLHEAVIRSKSLAASVAKLADHFPGSSHVMTHAMDQVLDETVWAFARVHDYILVTKDSDFQELSLLRGSPPKVIWIRHGNCTTNQIEATLRKHASDIQSLIENPEADFLLLY